MQRKPSYNVPVNWLAVHNQIALEEFIRSLKLKHETELRGIRVALEAKGSK